MIDSKQSILLCQEDKTFSQSVAEHLISNNYDVDICVDGSNYQNLLKKKEYDMCIIGVSLPNVNGFELASEIRSTDKEIPIIFLTVHSMKEDVIKGFKSGADDYITKPFTVEELVFRMEAVFRRVSKKPVQSVFHIGKFTFDTNHQTLSSENKETKLTTKECELLKLLCFNINSYVERAYALKTVWSDDTYFNARSMDVYITRLRKYLKADSSVEIHNIHGKGYRLIISNN